MRRYEHYRLDLVIEEAVRDKETGALQVRFAPNPDRYEWITYKGRRCLRDKFDHVIIPEEMLGDGLAKIAGTPIYYEPPLIENSQVYADGRRVPFGGALDGQSTPPTFADASDELLRSLPDGELNFAIMSVDMVGSTELAGGTDPATYTRVMGAITTELSRVVPLFHGHVLKYTGDGLIAYFRAPNFIGKNDLAIDCAIALLRVVRSAIDPALQERGMSPIELRIGLDSGSASIVTLGDPSTKQQKDILGLTVSLACKIQTQAAAGAIALGDETVRALHTSWRQQCRPLDTRREWGYRRDGKPYPLHQITLR